MSRSIGRHVFAMRALLLSCLVLLAGCLGELPPRLDDSRYPLQRWFPNNPGAQELALAAESGRLDDIRRLMQVEKVDPDTVFAVPEGFPLLVIPIMAKQPESLRTMLELGADPDARYPKPDVVKYKDGSVGTYYRNNAMVWAAKQEDPIYLKLLLDHGGDPDTRNSNDETLLFQARIWGNQWQNVQLLVERGADIDAKTQRGSILDTYAKMGGFHSAYWLLEKGANPIANDPIPGSPADRSYAIESIFWHPISKGYDPVWQRKCQRWLLARGYKRPPMPEYYQRMRKNLGFETREDKIPLL